MANIRFSFFAAGAEESHSGAAYNLTGVFLGGFAWSEFPASFSWAVVGRIDWADAEVEDIHEISVAVTSPEGLEPVEFDAGTVSRRAIANSDGTADSSPFVIPVSATFYGPGIYDVQIFVDGNQIDAPRIKVLHSPAGDDLTPDFFSSGQ